MSCSNLVLYCNCSTWDLSTRYYFTNSNRRICGSECRRTWSATYLKIYIWLCERQFCVVWVRFGRLTHYGPIPSKSRTIPATLLPIYDRPINGPYDRRQTCWGGGSYQGALLVSARHNNNDAPIRKWTIDLL